MNAASASAALRQDLAEPAQHRVAQRQRAYRVRPMLSHRGRDLGFCCDGRVACAREQGVGTEVEF